MPLLFFANVAYLHPKLKKSLLLQVQTVKNEAC